MSVFSPRRDASGLPITLSDGIVYLNQVYLTGLDEMSLGSSDWLATETIVARCSRKRERANEWLDEEGQVKMPATESNWPSTSCKWTVRPVEVTLAYLIRRCGSGC